MNFIHLSFYFKLTFSVGASRLKHAHYNICNGGMPWQHKMVAMVISTGHILGQVGFFFLIGGS